VKSVYTKVFRDKKCVLVAACDSDLIGKTFREGKLKLEVTSNFYGGMLTSIDETLELLNNADVANLVGSSVVDAAVKQGLVSPDAVILISGVPHVQIMKL
jgi:hypothetical protein